MTLQDLDATTVNGVLKWIIGVLITFIGGLVIYFRFEVKTLRDELKDERNYIKQEGAKNISALINNNSELESLNKKTDKNLDNISDIKQISETTKPIIEANSERIREIKSHFQNGN